MSEAVGQIEVIYGPMFSGKSTELLRKVRRYEHAKKSCLVINYLHDNRYSNQSVMSTHDKVTKTAIKISSLMGVVQKALGYNVVAIDQGQFFPDIVQFCQHLADNGVIVLVAALDGTFQRKAFGNIANLLPIAEKVTKLNAVCVFCTREAGFTLRIIDSQQIQLIGGDQAYKPVCRSCFISNTRRQKPTPKIQTSNIEGVKNNIPILL